MRVTMLHQISGYRDGQRWPAPGEDIDVPDDEANQLIDQRLAKPAENAAEKAAPATRSQPKRGEKTTATPSGEKR